MSSLCETLHTVYYMITVQPATLTMTHTAYSVLHVYSVGTADYPALFNTEICNVECQSGP